MPVTADGNDPNATHTASPSTAEPTSTGEPLPTTRRTRERLSVATQPRDPDRYQIINEHGRGGLGRVSRAHDLDLGRDVAIKELISRGNLSEVRFLREALITARLEHPGIVPVHEAGRWPDGTPFYAMKLVAGRPLRDLIAERTTVTERIRLLHHVIAVADAIAYAHGRNTIHRDLKPANVIVGDFGETIVIDWGLAKDLSTTEDATIDGGPFRANHDANLTSTGSVLGTPAYMAPEQERGEHVDQRADVFAIGAMLWELCSLQKVPPTDQRLRHRMLRRAGIDQDLVTIIDKALAPVASRRYPDAGTLAADLKAFKSGARITARRYSLWALLAHWTRRHGALAASVIGVLVLAFTGAILYVRSVTAERDRADTSEESARRARASAEDSLDQLTLKHAQLLLTRDPSAALDALTPYHGVDTSRASQIRAEARGRGVSPLRAVPHTGMVRWVAGTPDGAIISLGTDGIIARTSPQGFSVSLTEDVASAVQLSYSSARRILAYACNPSNLCMYDVVNNAKIPTGTFFRGMHPVGISFSQDGNLLALMSQDTTLRIIDVTIPALPKLRLVKRIRTGSDVVVFHNDIVIAGTPNGIEFVHTNRESEPFSVPNNSFWDVNPEQTEFAVATIEGKALLFRGTPMRLVSQIELCQGPVVGLKFIPNKSELAFGCRDGRIGVWDVQRKMITTKARVGGHADLISVDVNGEYIAAAGGNGAVVIFDLKTNLATTYIGHESSVTALAAPTASYPLFISADSRGVLRTWPRPTRLASLAVTRNSQFDTNIFARKSSTVIATTRLPTLTTFSPSSGVRSFGPHEPFNFSLLQSTSGNTFVAYGSNELIEFWNASTMTRTNLLDTKHGSVSQVSFAGDSDNVITSGHDGRLIHWTASGLATVLAQIDQPIDFFALLRPDAARGYRTVVFSSFDGGLWHTNPGGKPVLFKAGGARVSRILTLPDGKTMLAGTVKGDVIAIDTTTWTTDDILKIHDSIRQISTTHDGQRIVIGTYSGAIHVATMRGNAYELSTMTWRRLNVNARRHLVTSDGLLVAVCSDGLIWFYSFVTQKWGCLPVVGADLRWIAISSEGNAAAALDTAGRLIWIELDTIRTLLVADDVNTKGIQ